MGRRFPFSYFAPPDSYAAVPRASGSVVMFCAPVLLFGGTEGVRSRFHVLRSRTHFGRYRGVGSRFLVLLARTRFRRFWGHRVPFSCFARPDSFSTVLRASGSVFTFCAPRLVFGGTGGSGPIFLFYAPGVVFGGTEGVGSCFHVLRARTHFRRYRVPFSCFARPDSFSTIPRALGPILRSRTSFRRYRVVRSRFLVLTALTRFARTDSFSAVPRASGPVFVFCAPGLVFGGTEAVGSRFYVFCSRTRFQRYRGRRVPFSCFARPDSFSTVPTASGPVFMYCAPGLIFDGTEGVGSLFHVLRARTRFRWYRGRRVPFSCFARTDSFSVVPRASGPILMFCAPGLIFCGTDGVGSRFHVMSTRTLFRRYRGRHVSFSCFARPDSFSAVPRASGPAFMFHAPGLVFDGAECVEFRFHVLRSRTRFRRYQGRRVLFFMFCTPRLIFDST
jgi:hypothetical protein